MFNSANLLLHTPQHTCMHAHTSLQWLSLKIQTGVCILDCISTYYSSYENLPHIFKYQRISVILHSLILLFMVFVARIWQRWVWDEQVMLAVTRHRTTSLEMCKRKSMLLVLATQSGKGEVFSQMLIVKDGGNEQLRTTKTMPTIQAWSWLKLHQNTALTKSMCSISNRW